MSAASLIVELRDLDRRVVQILMPAFGGSPKRQCERVLAAATQGSTYALLKEGVAVAAVITHSDGADLVVDAIAVDAAVRGRGFGRELMEFLVASLTNTASIQLETDDEGVGFYRALGFRISLLPEQWPEVHRYQCRLP